MFDIHLHINDFFSDFFKFTIQDLIKYLETAATHGSIVMPMIRQHSDSRLINNNFFNKINDVISRLNLKIYPFLWAHPYLVTSDWIEELKPKGIKFHPSISQKTIADAENLLEHCRSFSIPLLIHCGRGEKSSIDHLIPYLNKYDDVTIIIGHMGGLATELILRAHRILKVREPGENIFFDTSGCVNPQIISNAINQFGPKQIVFGSDIPFFDWRVCKHAIDLAIQDSEISKINVLSDFIQDRIYHNNALTLFGKNTV